ncbi:cysteine desulfurase family protein [Serpentinicella sp. ANB-PHB4]|uniref:cysteine desulfurase family protein n=1 Tax=Serpentinicella sp. ANB-PHB4 TaxID=3074076 RepID=UPI00285FF4AF|nr:cysteine desulfurase family protein [Serpentinicella sp. ANB-PHB4]MDR5660051.1 cysteine desulfurase family protein [Serpentinicella sp. ANB-PHB4]
MEVYLDNAASTKPYEEVIEVITSALRNLYANPSSLHKKGLETEKEIRRARNIIAKSIGCAEKDFIFTSGGTEANNLAINGLINSNKRIGKHIVTTRIEHKSILSTFDALKNNGYDITYLDVDKQGFVCLDQFKKSIRPDTALVSIMHANNEVGSIQSVKEISHLIKKINPKTLFHVDGVQAYGKIKVNIAKTKIDAYSISGHKIHGPKGVGGLYIRPGVKISPIIFGGSQEYNLRAGTENVPGIIGFSKAVELIFDKNHVERLNEINKLKTYFYNCLDQNIEEIHFNSDDNENYLPNIINVSILGIRSEIMLHSLEQKGIFISSGSACTSRKKDISHVLEAMGLKHEQIDSAIRISLSQFTTKEEIDYTVEQMKNEVQKLRKIIKR